jgi:hypothetical protein
MEQVSNFEIIFESGSLTDQLNALENALLRGGISNLEHGCYTGRSCKSGSTDECSSGICCEEGSFE